jgi:catechol 2,3-dioxygenase-like lactoylglutathione lyase family enzyme
VRLALVTIVVREYDEAIKWYTSALGFSLIEDSDLRDGKRWVRVRAPGGGSDMLLARAANSVQRSVIGHAGGGRVSLFLHTDDFWKEYKAMKDKGVVFAETPRDEPYGTVVVFLDLYGNKWDLVGLNEDNAGINT